MNIPNYSSVASALGNLFQRKNYAQEAFFIKSSANSSLAARIVFEEAIGAINNARVRASDTTCFLKGLQIHPRYFSHRGVVRFRLLDELFILGATIRVARIERYLSVFGDAAYWLAKRAGSGWLNLYLSPFNSFGLGPHSDEHHVVAFQIVGSKSWELWTGTRATHGGGVTSEIGESDRNVQVNQGDALYVPRGMYHRASTVSAISAHLTWGFKDTAVQSLARHRFPTVATVNLTRSSDRGLDASMRTKPSHSAIVAASYLAHLYPNCEIRLSREKRPKTRTRETLSWAISGSRSIFAARAAFDRLAGALRTGWTPLRELLSIFEKEALLRFLTALLFAGVVHVRSEGDERSPRK